VLAGDSSDEEEDAGDLAASPGVAFSPRSGPYSVTLGDFFDPAWQKVTAAAASVVGRRRQRFALGGHGPWYLRNSALALTQACAVSPLPGGDSVVELFPPWPVLSIPPVASSVEPVSLSRPASVAPPADAARC
jgi:hypothetical protein